jgi:hypothetical protein
VSVDGLSRLAFIAVRSTRLLRFLDLRPLAAALPVGDRQKGVTDRLTDGGVGGTLEVQTSEEDRPFGYLRPRARIT